jgi:hypothetical protein
MHLRVEGDAVLRRIRAAFAVAAATTLTLLLGTTGASAHQWGSWSWNRSGSTVTIQVYNYAANSGAANQALNDWDSHTILSLPRLNSHTDISVYDENAGNTGWIGLATIVNYSGNYITHAHAEYNTYYSESYDQIVGTYCQEIGHTFGLDHSNDGCMGLGYYNNLTYTVQHNWTDIYNMYINPHFAGATVAPSAQFVPVWRYHPTSAPQAARMGDSVVRATVTSVRQGPDIVKSAPAEPGGVTRVPTQSITLRTDETLKGHAARTFTIFRTGSATLSTSGDPAYQAGEQYVLVLKGKRADGRRVLLSPEGRYRVTGGSVQAISDTPGVAKVNGMSYTDFRSLIRR